MNIETLAATAGEIVGIVIISYITYRVVKFFVKTAKKRKEG